MKAFVSILMLLGLTSQVALADIPECRRDRKEYCSNVGNNSYEIGVCLSKYFFKLSPACKNKLVTGARGWDSIKKSCAKQLVGNHCGEVTPGNFIVLACIAGGPVAVSSECHSAIEGALNAYFP